MGGPDGERWRAHLDPFESMIVDVGDPGIAAAGFQPGERVIDIGCRGGKDDDWSDDDVPSATPAAAAPKSSEAG